MDIMLVNARVKDINNLEICHSLPIGLAYIGAVLHEAGYDISAIDLNAAPVDMAKITQIFERASPPILAISTSTPTHLNGLAFARLAKEANPEIKVVMGGPHASILYEEVVMEKEVDIVVRGEGEYTMLEVADCLIRKRGNLASVKGIAYKDNGAIRVTDKRPFIKDPDELSFPARNLFPFDLYELPNTVLASRGGCPFACHFCAVNNIWGRTRRYRNPEKVVSEIFSVIDTFGFKEAGKITFLDDAFGLDRELTKSLCRLLKQLRLSIPLSWRCTTRVDLVDAELITEMWDAGCCGIHYGIEAGSQKILDSIGKKTNLDQIRRAVDLTLSFGMDTLCAFMFPHPEDTEQTIREQKQFMKELTEMGANTYLSLTVPYPGTYLYEKADRLGIKILTKNLDKYDGENLIITTKNLSKERLQFLYEELCQVVS
ncbi:B12-binding domain-containing radical SAM protein [Chloroflexota bacterium]